MLLAVAVGGFFKFTEPVLGEIDELKAERAKLNEALDNARELRKVQDSLLAAYREIAPSDLERLNKFLPDNIDNVRLIIDVNNIARQSGMTIKNIKIKTAAGEEESSVIEKTTGNELEPESLTLGFSVSGPYGNFQKFLSDLARSLRLVDVEAVGFSSSEGGEAGASDLYTYNVEIKTYWLK
jgi:Tfp pilus assembly protein PilO